MSTLDIPFDRYPRFDELTEHLQRLAAEHPELLDLDVLGRSHEGRELWIATVTNTATGPHDAKPAVWLDGNIHASEVTASVSLLGTSVEVVVRSDRAGVERASVDLTAR